MITWHLDYGRAIGGEWDEVVGGNRYQGYIWEKDSGGARYAVEDEDDAKAIVEMLNDREQLKAALDALLKAINADRNAEDACIRELNDKHMTVREETSATLIIREREARALLR